MPGATYGVLLPAGFIASAGLLNRTSQVSGGPNIKTMGPFFTGDFLYPIIDENGGNHKIEGVTTVSGIGSRKLVMLMPSKTYGAVKKTLYSNEDGTFVFNNLKAGTYLVLAVDTSEDYNAVVYSYIVAVPM